MLTSRYMGSVTNLPAIMKTIQEGNPPSKFTYTHLDGLGFKSSTDRGIIPLLKDLGFLTADGVPTQRYRLYRDKTESRRVLGEALKEAYADLFLISENLGDQHREKIEGKFKSMHNISDWVAGRQAATFLTLLKMADVSGSTKTMGATAVAESPASIVEKEIVAGSSTKKLEIGGLHYTIQIHLPPTKDIEVYNAIFKSLRANLID